MCQLASWNTMATPTLDNLFFLSDNFLWKFIIYALFHDLATFLYACAWERKHAHAYKKGPVHA